jgi:phosphate transport system ATP-binding protein
VTGFMLMHPNTRAGQLVEFDRIEKMFTDSTDKRTADYISGRFG